MEGLNLLRDIRSGCAASELMSKYRLSEKGLEVVLEQLSEAIEMSVGDLLGRAESADYKTELQSLRSVRRINLLLPVEVCCAEDPQRVGILLDITESGLKVRGLKAETGETSTLVVRSAELLQIAQFQLQATCKWVDNQDTAGDCLAGYEITGVSLEDKERMEDFIQIVS